MIEEPEIRKQIEALLFSSGRPMSVEDLASITGLEKRKVKKALVQLKDDYDSRDSSLMVIQENDSWKLNIRERYVSLVTKIVADTELSKTVLETLGVVAWKAPTLQSEVIKTRGGQAYEHIKDLVGLGFINKEKEGRSFILKLSEKFFEYFDVPGEKGIKDALKVAKTPEVVNLAEEESLSKQEKMEREEEKKIIQQREKEELVKRLEQKRQDIRIDRDFLDSVSGKIGEFSKKNDELEKDELFKRSQSDETNIGFENPDLGQDSIIISEEEKKKSCSEHDSSEPTDEDDEKNASSTLS